MNRDNFREASEDVTIKNIPICFVHLAIPSAPKIKDGPKPDPKYSVTVLLDKDEHASIISELQESITSLARQSWGAKADKLLNGRILWSPLRDGDLERDRRPEFENKMFMLIGTKPRGYISGANVNYRDLGNFTTYPGPAVGYINKSRTGIVNVGDPEFDFNEIYSGSIACISATAQTYKHDSGGKGVTIFLRGVLKTGDGERLDGSGPVVLEEFFADELKDLLTGEPEAAKPKTNSSSSNRVPRRASTRSSVDDDSPLGDLDVSEYDELYS